MRPTPPDPSRFKLDARPRRSDRWSLNQNPRSTSSSSSSVYTHRPSLSSSAIYSSSSPSPPRTAHVRLKRQVPNMPPITAQAKTHRKLSLVSPSGTSPNIPQLLTFPTVRPYELLDSSLSPVLESPASPDFRPPSFPSGSAAIRGSPATSPSRPFSVHSPSFKSSPRPHNASTRPLSVVSLSSTFSYEGGLFSTPQRDSPSIHSRTASTSSSSSMASISRSVTLLPIGRKTKQDATHNRAYSLCSPSPPLIAKPPHKLDPWHLPEPRKQRTAADYRAVPGGIAHKGLGLACVPLPEDYAPSRASRPAVKSTSETPSPSAPISVLRTSVRQEPPIDSCDGPGRRGEARRRRRQGVDFHSNTQFSMILQPGFAFNDPENVGSSVKEIVQESPDLEDDASLECSPMEGRSPREAGGGCDNADGSRESCAPLARPGDAKRDFGLVTKASYANTNSPLDESQAPVPPQLQASPSLHSAPQSSPFDHGPPSHLNSSVSSLRLEPTKMQVASCPWHSLSTNELLSPNAEFTGAYTYDQYEHNDFECSGELRSAFDSDTDHEDDPSSSPQHRPLYHGSPRRNYGRDNSNHVRSPSGKFRRFRNALRGSISVGNLNGKNKSKGVIPPDTVPGTLGMPTDISVSGEVRQESRIQLPSRPFHTHTTSTSSTVATLPAGLATFSAPDRGAETDAGKISGKGVTTPVDADEVMLLGFQQERCKSDLRLATSLIDHSGSGSPGTSAHPRSSSIPELPESCCQSAKVLISGQSPTTNSPSELGSPPDIPLPPTPPLPPPLSLPSIMHFPHLPKLLPHPYLSSSPVKTLANDDDPFYGDSREIVDIGGGCRLTFVDPEESMAMLELSMAKLQMYAPDGSLRKSANLQDWVQIVVKEVQGADEAQDHGEPAQQELPHQRQPAVSLTPSTFARLELCAPIAIPPLGHPKDAIKVSPPSGKHHGRQPSLTLLPLFDFEKSKRPIKWSCAKHSKLARRTSSLINLQDSRIHSHGISPGPSSSSSGSSSMTDLPGSSTSESVHSNSPVGPGLESKEGTPSKTVPFLLRPVRHDRLHAHPKHSLSAPNSPTKNTRQYNHSHDHSNLLDEDTETETITPSSLSHSFSPSLLADSSEHLPQLHYNFLLHDYHKSDRSSKVRKLWERVGVRTERSVRSLRGSFAAHG